MSWRRGLELGLAALLALLLGLDLAWPPPLPKDDGRALVVLAADGRTPLRAWPGADGAWRQPITPAEVSPLYLQALLGYEDRAFRWHPGVNPWALGRAAWQWVRAGRIVSGGSTLTMQLARILEPELAERRPRAKLRQVLRALQLELRLSKDEILTLYLNQAPMGGIVRGVEMASRLYLGRSSAELSAAEAALLTALPRAPSRLRPDRDPAAARAARDRVLARLQQQGVWSAATVREARQEAVASLPAFAGLGARWLAPLAAERLRAEAPLAERRAGRVHSLIDAELQAGLERLLLARAASLPPKVSIAALVVENRTLAVRAYAGSVDFSDPERAAHVDMVRGLRSPGSALKPFVYALALDEGLIHSESLLVDAPQSFGGYSPGNFQAEFSGPVSAADALRRSLNVPAVDLLERLGPARVAGWLQAGGLTLHLPRHAAPNLSLVLGGAAVRLQDLAGAYTALARGGLAGMPRLHPDEPMREARLMSEGAAFIVREILESGGQPGRPFQQQPRRLAFKTGTSFGFRDAWALGVTDAYTLGVWVGRPDGTPNPGHFGANTAAPLLHELLALLHETPQARRVPASVSAASICWPLGLAAAQTAPAHCLQRRSAWLLEGSAAPTLPDRLDPSPLLQQTPCGERLRWPLALQPWTGGATGGATGGSQGGCPPQRGRESVPQAWQLRGLEDGERLHGVQGIGPLLSLRTEGGTGWRYWLLDGQLVARTQAGQTLALRLPPGSQQLTVLDEAGRFEQRRFSVR